MQTRYTPLVSLKKSSMQSSERAMQKANADLNSASMALELSYRALDEISVPQSGNATEFRAYQTLLLSQRQLIQHNQEWVAFAQEQVEHARVKLKQDMIEHEKMKYLELQEINKALETQKKAESKELDEVARMTFHMGEK